MKTTPFALALVATIMVGGCSDSGVVTDLVEPGGSGAPQSRLKTINDPEVFYSALKDALINQPGGSIESLGEPVFEPVADSDVASSPPQAGESNSNDTTSAESNDVTSTNVQEAGVDEQDRVKINAAGTQLFVLNNSNVYGGEIFFTESDISVDPFGDISESESQFDSPPGATLRILALDAETPDASSINELSLDLEGRNADGFYLYENGEQASVIVTASGGGFWGYWDQPYSFSGLTSIVSKVDVADAEHAATSETVTLDGQIISSRRIGDSLFFASRYYPEIPDARPYEQSADEWRTAVEAADLASLMPNMSRSSSEQTTPLADASSCFVAPTSNDSSYYSPDIITLGVIDLATMQLRDSQCFLGATETLYATTQSVFLATTQYDYQTGPVAENGEVIDTDSLSFESEISWSDPRTTTEIHRFSIDTDQLTYTGSGSVRGHLGWNELQKPFRMSESNGYLRIATMNDQQGQEHSPILLNVLQADDSGDLKIVGNLPNDVNPAPIGKPGERLYASRFIGDRAYLVTFRQTDPLYVIDLENPTDPEIAGELEIDGYSDYLHPVGENHLLGIGKDAVPALDGFGDNRGAWVQGIKLSLFDVSDPASPTEVQSVHVGERGTDSVALQNHRAIAIQSANENHPMRVSFGINVYGDASPTSLPEQNNATRYASWSYTGLHGFDITAGANASITPRGALIVKRAGSDSEYGGYFGDDRSVMVGDAVFYINGKDVYPALWDNLALEPQAR